MCAAIEATLDRGVEEMPHQFRFKKAENGPLVNFAIVVPSAAQLPQTSRASAYLCHLWRC